MTEKSWMFALLEEQLINVVDPEAPCKNLCSEWADESQFYQTDIESLIKIKLKSMANFNAHNEWRVMVIFLNI